MSFPGSPIHSTSSSLSLEYAGRKVPLKIIEPYNIESKIEAELLFAGRFFSIEEVSESTSKVAQESPIDFPSSIDRDYTHSINAKGQTHLMLCIQNMFKNKKYLETAKHEISKGIDVNAQDANGWTALMYLCLHLTETPVEKKLVSEMMEELVNNGAKFNIQNSEKLTAFDLATHENKVHIILLSKEIDEDTSSQSSDQSVILSDDENPNEEGELKNFHV